VESSELAEALHRLFDRDLMYHGFTNYMRDYELIVYQSVDPNPRYGLVPRHLRFLFRFCSEAGVRSTVSPDAWSESMDDRLLHLRTVTREAEGYVWGVQCQNLYPGATIVEDSPRARFWQDQIGVPFHEVLIEANAHTICLVFSDLTIEQVGEGYTPYQIVRNGDPERYASRTKIPLNPPDS